MVRVTVTTRASAERQREKRPRAGAGGSLHAGDMARLLPGAELRFGDPTDPASLARDGFRGEAFDVLVSCLASRTGTPRDAWAIDHDAHLAAITAIYAHHVRHGTASYEIDPPDQAEMGRRLDAVLTAGSPWLVALDDGGDVLGYAYAAQFRPRAAYRFGCENSIYIRHDCRGQGLGKLLLGALIEAAESCGFRQMIAVIGGAEPASIALHGALGFAHAGTMRSIGRKQGRWLDTVYMQRQLGLGDSAPPPEEPQ